MTDPTLLAALLCAIVVGGEYLCRTTPARHFGTALVVILLGALLANLGLIPAGSPPDAPTALYEGIFHWLAPLAIFWLLLAVDLRRIWQAGAKVLTAFGAGLLGTTIGALVGVTLAGGRDVFGDQFGAIGGMFVGTYTGGSINFNAVAIHYEVFRDGPLYAGAVAVDNIVTAVWMAATIALPRLLLPFWPKAQQDEAAAATEGFKVDHAADDETFGPLDLGLTLGLGLFALFASERLAEATSIPSLLILTAVALALAQTPWGARLRGAQALGMFSVYVFLTVIGAFCDLAALSQIGSLATAITILASVTVAIHALITFGACRLLKIDPVIAAVASQANIGGGTSALALARTLRRDDLVLPAVLAGSLGNGVGTFLGFAAAGLLG